MIAAPFFSYYSTDIRPTCSPPHSGVSIRMPLRLILHYSLPVLQWSGPAPPDFSRNQPPIYSPPMKVPTLLSAKDLWLTSRRMQFFDTFWFFLVGQDSPLDFRP